MKKLFIRVLVGRHNMERVLRAQRHLKKGHAINLSLVFFITCILSCGTVKVYKEADKPIFFSNEKRFGFQGQADSLTVITFNIKAAEKIQMAIDELQKFEKTRNVDV